MLDFLEKSKDKEYDTLFFLSGKNKGTVQLQFNMYKDRGEKLGGSDMGDCYHIILFNEDETGELVNVDMFDAILICPLEYISELIKQKWYGIIARKTTTSEQFISKTYEKLIEK